MTRPQTKPRASRSGPSGAHIGPRYLLSIESAEQRQRWELAAKREGRTLANWLRRVADEAAQRARRNLSDWMRVTLDDEAAK